MVSFTEALLQALHENHTRGWAQIPVHGITDEGACTCSRGRDCPSAGKHPVMPAWGKNLLTYEELVEQFSTPDPYNLGIVTGPPSGIFVVDIDVRHGGLDSVETLAEQGYHFHGQLTSLTGGGGYHLIYRLPPGVDIRSSAGSLAPGIDIRAAGGMIVAPPSRHHSGAYYVWDTAVIPSTMPEDPPEWLLKRLRAASSAAVDLVIEPGRKLQEGQRHPPFLRVAGMLHRYGATEQAVYRTLRALDEEICDPQLGDEEVKRIAHSSSKWEPQREADFIDPKNYLQLAYDYLQARYTHLDGRTLHHWQGMWYSWDGSAYREIDAAEIRADAVQLHAKLKVRKMTKEGVKEEPFKPDIKHGNEFIRALETQAMLSGETPWPSWSNAQEKRLPASQILVCRNGLLALQTRELLKHTPAYLNRHRLEIDYDAGAAEPVEWLRFLHEIWDKDPESIDALQQIFGYLVAGGLEQQAMFLILGPPRSGKGTIGIVLEHLVGRHNSVSPTLSCLASSFGLEPLIDKRVALISDCRLGRRANQSAIVEKLLPYSAGDTQLVNRKHKSMQTVRPTARFLFLTNELPGFFDASGALASRFVILKLLKSYVGREDRTLQARLLKELPGILLWSLDGFDRLQERGRFLQPESGQDVSDDLLEMTSQVADFVKQKCVIGEDQTVTKKDLFDRYIHWLAMEQGWHTAITMPRFTSELRAVVPTISNLRPKAGADGQRPRMWRGIGLRAPSEGPPTGMLPA